MLTKRRPLVPATRLRRPLGLAFAVTGLIVFSAGPASANHVTCGQQITKNTTLDADLVCTPSETALTIAADGVKLDLGGHMVTTFGGVGVLNDGHDGVTIRSGSFLDPGGRPIVLSNANDNRLEDLAAGGGGGAVSLDDSDDNRLVRNQFGEDIGGLILRNGSDRNVIERNDLSGGLGGGLLIFDSDDNLVSRNFNFCCGEAAPGLLVGAGSDNTTLRRNELLSQGIRDGIVVRSETTNTLLLRNEVREFLWGNGIQVDSPSATLTRNISNDNGGWGILAVPGVIDGGRNTASGNAVGQCLNVSC